MNLPPLCTVAVVVGVVAGTIIDEVSVTLARPKNNSLSGISGVCIFGSICNGNDFDRAKAFTCGDVDPVGNEVVRCNLESGKFASK
ncbi:hypothetical protein DERP_012769 [Dermatophagoides pteronyssinus]|uniref:Secreted protein n=1 Tax=Dermatophagoides pteronyssinus TaxID=6956 RepID=A0ABQ8JQS2_DERPT|nr:hypothetical protein DERP_012769 [Dermatophagoides pteronyssinus]